MFYRSRSFNVLEKYIFQGYTNGKMVIKVAWNEDIAINMEVI